MISRSLLPSYVRVAAPQPAPVDRSEDPDLPETCQYLYTDYGAAATTLRRAFQQGAFPVAFRKFFGYIHDVASTYFRRRGPLLARGIAYSILVGSIPLMFLALFTASQVLALAPDLQLTLELRLDELIPAELADAILAQAARISARSWTEIGIVGMIGLVLVASSIFASIEGGLAEIMRCPKKRTLWVNQLIYLSATLVAIILFFTASFANMYVKIFYEILGVPDSYHWLGKKTTSIIMIWLALFVLYRGSYRGRLSYVALTTVSLIVATLWQLLNFAGSRFITASGRVEFMYGVLASVVVFMLWSYVFSVLLLLGGIVIVKHTRWDSWRARVSDRQ